MMECIHNGYHVITEKIGNQVHNCVVNFSSPTVHPKDPLGPVPGEPPDAGNFCHVLHNDDR